jgi:hypothetical protein
VTLLISLSYCEYVPSSSITNIPFYYLVFNLVFVTVGNEMQNREASPDIPVEFGAGRTQNSKDSLFPDGKMPEDRHPN